MRCSPRSRQSGVADHRPGPAPDRRAVTLASGSVAVTREAADVARRVAEQAAAAVFAAA
ncbi:hypothetical protein [Rhodococcoides corynebacterioides]|uniref:hypothetical protein n=1 Tax=Rhodococcoides corynebacterioides TaxID=53972 RepID=UPI000A74FFBA|nr:hypothetical protein [Rhodococcus corynebacterioides]